MPFSSKASSKLWFVEVIAPSDADAKRNISLISSLSFLEMFKRGLAYESNEPINWCPKCQTGLANEDLEGGKCERCGTQVKRKKMRQWVLKMTDYADRLLYDLDKEGLDWEESIKEQQGNWIGRSTGVSKFMDRVNYLSPLTDIRKVKSPLNKNRELYEARDVHGTHWGRLGPIETPDGPQCGLVKNLALMAEVTTETNEEPIEEMLKKKGVTIKALR